MNFRQGWNALTDEERKVIMDMPNFDWEIFAYLMENNIKMNIQGFKNLLN
jgi:hypothetical protein